VRLKKFQPEGAVV